MSNINIRQGLQGMTMGFNSENLRVVVSRKVDSPD